MSEIPEVELEVVRAPGVTSSKVLAAFIGAGAVVLVATAFAAAIRL